MFNTFNKDTQIVDKYINSCHINKNNIYLLRYKLSIQDNPKKYLADFFKDIKKGSVVAVTETIVYDEDAYLNATISKLYNKHRRFYTVNEILDFIKNDAMLNYFINFKETIYINNITHNIQDEAVTQQMLNQLNNFPDNIKTLLSFKEENGSLVSFEPNVAVFIMIKK